MSAAASRGRESLRVLFILLLGQLVWEENLLKNCAELKAFYKWPQELAEMVKTKKLARKKYMQEFNDLKYQQKQPLTQEK